MDKVFWTVSACDALEHLRPSEQEIQQIKGTLLELSEKKKAGIPVPFHQHPGEFVIYCGRFALIYRPQSDKIVVTDIEACDQFA